ncbi:MAG: hypothetical protein K1X87_02415 [Dehalococcoidia bacterium]|nr:hypothetical protein [Dehalococcoidia bacterium]HRC62093.1 DUF6391 domain-containing protein [Dehalococcoidia bacterium]
MLKRWADAVRRNHALEHATVAVLLARHGPRRLAGRASVDGFLIASDVDSEELTSCAREALERLQAGQASLAVSPLCGTNIAVSGLMAAAAATAALAKGKERDGRFANAFMAAMVAVVAAQPVGRLVQEHLTTRPDLDDVEVIDTKPVFGGLRKVRTRSVIRA